PYDSLLITLELLGRDHHRDISAILLHVHGPGAGHFQHLAEAVLGVRRRNRAHASTPSAILAEIADGMPFRKGTPKTPFTPPAPPPSAPPDCSGGSSSWRIPARPPCWCARRACPAPAAAW